VIYNGIDVCYYEPVRSFPKRGPLRILVVGALHARKGQDFAIAALAQLSRRGLEAELTFVGSGPTEAELRDQAVEAGVSARVHFAGSQLDPRQSLQSTDVFLLPSRQEGFSNALLEAMATGLPIIATDVGGNAEALEDGVGGRVVQPKDVDAMADALANLAEDRGQLAVMGKRNRERVSELFTLDRSAQRLAGWYLRS
jgi:glycosyltransferase involved in cell wall biosynthesis